MCVSIKVLVQKSLENYLMILVLGTKSFKYSFFNLVSFRKVAGSVKKKIMNEQKIRAKNIELSKLEFLMRLDEINPKILKYLSNESFINARSKLLEKYE